VWATVLRLAREHGPRLALSAARLTPQFRLDEVHDLSGRYRYPGDDRMAELGEAAMKRGYFNKKEFLEVVEWKSGGRQRGNAAKNSAEAIRKATATVIGNNDDSTWMKAMTELEGVGMPTASVFRHFTRKDRPILDRRALQALGMDKPPQAYSLKFWETFRDTCKAAAEKADVPMRTLDRAMWEWSRRRGKPLS
jgi:hypothetical protein